MQAMDDLELLREYAANHSETAFEELVSRRVGFVYSSALRQARDPNLAGEITQVVFIILAQKAGRISGKTILTGWLFKTTRFAALAQMRADAKLQRQKKEFQMQTEIQPTAADKVGQASSLSIWDELSPLLDEALATLGETDRQAVLLRFFENKSLAEVGNYLGAGKDTARKRVTRAVEKLRKFFAKRGVSSTTAIIAGVISANSVQAAPVALAKSVTAVAIVKGSIATASTLTLVKGTMKTMTWIKIKFALGMSMAMLVASGVATVAISQTSNGDNLAAQEIMKKSQGAYAGLTSYSDEGKEVGSVGKADVAPHTFSIKLARPNLYQIKWTQDLGFYSQTGVVWSASNGDYLKMQQVSKPEKYPNTDGALSAAMGISGGASGIVPKSSFNLKSGIFGAMQSATKKSDEKIGGTDCYVLTQSKGGRTETLWIGKQDFLIRQIENDTSAAILKAMMEDQAKKHPEMHLPTTVGGDVKSVQTHMNIEVNQTIPITDFAP